MKTKWNHCIVVDVNDVRKHFQNIVLIAACFAFLNVASKWSNSDISLKVKHEVLQELEKGAFQKNLAQKYRIPPNIISTWRKNKNKIFESYEKGLNSKRIKPEVFEAMNKALMKRLLNLCSERKHSREWSVAERKGFWFCKRIWGAQRLSVARWMPRKVEKG